MGTAPQKRSKIILNGKMRKDIWDIFNPLSSKIFLLWGRDVLHDMGAVLTMQPAHRMTILPYDQEQVSDLMIGPFFSCSTTSQFDNHYPENKICQFFKLHPVIVPSIVKKSAFK